MGARVLPFLFVGFVLCIVLERCDFDRTIKMLSGSGKDFDNDQESDSCHAEHLFHFLGWHKNRT